MTVNCVEVAEVTVALVAPNQTKFSAGVELKPVPEIVNVVPIGPDTGESEVIVVCPASAFFRQRTEKPLNLGSNDLQMVLLSQYKAL